MSHTSFVIHESEANAVCGASSVPQFSHKGSIVTCKPLLIAHSVSFVVLVTKAGSVELYSTNDKSLESSWTSSKRPIFFSRLR